MSADDLLSIKLLAENDADFNYLKGEATLYLKSALQLLNNSPFLRSKFQGDGIPQASILAELLKQRADTLNFQNHVDDLSKQLLAREMSKTNMVGMEPVSIPIFQPDGTKYRFPANILGLRQGLNAGGTAVRANAFVLGTKKMNAYGNAMADNGAITYNNAEDDAELRITNNNYAAGAGAAQGWYDIRHYMS